MPILRHPEGARVFFSHVPKTGGTYVENLLGENGFERLFWDKDPKGLGLVISPQHFHAEIFRHFIDIEAFDVALMTVRHPVDRLISEYRSMLNDHGQTFLDWMDTTEPAYAESKSIYDNHLRPQVEFYLPGLEVHKSERQFTERWGKRLGHRLGMTFEHLTVRRRRDTKNRVPLELGKTELDRAVSFCEEAYAEDFAFFDYAVDAAEELRDRGYGSSRHQRALRAEEAEGALVANIGQRGPDTDPPGRRGKRSGVYRSDGSAIVAANFYRHNNNAFFEDHFDAIRQVDARAIYGGPLFIHFGHFLIESLSRLWYLHENPDPDARIVWSVSDSENDHHGSGQFPDHHRMLLDWLGIENEVMLIDKPTRFRSVVVPQPGAEIPGMFHPQLAAFLERSGPDHAPEPGFKVWLSRTRFNASPETEGTEGMPETEAKLAKSGWQIVHPQELPFSEQLALLSRAERVAGEEGTALHLLLFIRNIRGLRVDIVPRLEELKGTYHAIAKVKGFEQNVIELGPPRIHHQLVNKVLKSYPTLRPILKALT